MSESLKGRRFGRLKAIRPVQVPITVLRWECRCDCGKTIVTSANALKAGATKSCGCYRKDVQRARLKALTKHGAARRDYKTPEYITWLAINARCYNPNSEMFSAYGGRGITVCSRWRRNFSAFLQDMGQKPGKRFTIERINNNLGYSPKNCRWATYSEQMRNTRRTRIISLDDKAMCLTDWSEKTGIPMKTIHRRLAAGWSARDALTTPVRRK